MTAPPPTEAERAWAELKAKLAETWPGRAFHNLLLGLNGDPTKRPWRFGFFAYIALVFVVAVVCISFGWGEGW